jgi:hypothetical protein
MNFAYKMSLGVCMILRINRIIPTSKVSPCFVRIYTKCTKVLCEQNADLFRSIVEIHTVA